MSGSEFMLLVKSGGGYLGWTRGGGIATIPNNLAVELLHKLEQGGVILRTKTRDEISLDQYHFLLGVTPRVNVPADYDSLLDPEVKRHSYTFGVCGVNCFIEKAKQVGYVCGVRLGDSVIWDDGDFQPVLTPHPETGWPLSWRAGAWRSYMKPWDGSHGMFH